MFLAGYFLLTSSDTFAVGYIVQPQNAARTRKLSYRKDDRAMRPMYGMGALKIVGSP